MIKFNYKTYGDKSLQPLLLLHGFLGSHKEYQEIKKELSKQFYLIIPDLPGHGQTKTSDNEEYCMPVCAGELLNLLDSINVEQPHLLGYSMGGRLALHLTVNYPDRFNKIILESSSPGLKSVEERQVRIVSDLRLMEKIKNSDMYDFVSTWYRLPLFKTIDKSSKKYNSLIESRLINNKAGLCLSLEKIGTGAQPSLWENLPEIKNDLLMIVGEEDEKFVRIANSMINENNNFKIQTVSGVSHNIHFEKPDEYTRIVQQFLIK